MNTYGQISDVLAARPLDPKLGAKAGRLRRPREARWFQVPNGRFGVGVQDLGLIGFRGLGFRGLGFRIGLRNGG